MNGIRNTNILCKSEDGNIIEEIYKIPFDKEIKYKRRGIDIYKYDIKGALFKVGWYEQYRVKDKEKLNRANKIWKEILDEYGKKY